MSVKITGTHQGHRKRLKSRFLNSGLKDFEDHNIMELLLFYAVPYKDTNELAHRIIDRFGSIEKAFDADFEKLCEVEGVGENIATLIKLVPEISKFYLNLKKQEPASFRTTEDIAAFLQEQYLFDNRECFSILCLDNSGGFLGFEKMQTGTANMTEVSIIKAIEIAVRNNAACVVICHNHPGGTLEPSSEDIITTRRLLDAFKAVSIRVMDHMIVTKKSYLSLINTRQYGSLFGK
ncbi:MAG: RadC family protein [Clostridia bacterium]|nr:RadC family protein [Clostridia bacterium]